MKDFLTVVIPCKNESKYIADTLLSLNNQSGMKDVRVIIADGNSDDNTVDIIQSLSGFVRYNIEVIEGGTVSVGRNNGAKLCTTPYILFLDADTNFKNKTTIRKSLFKMFKGYKLVTCKLMSRSYSFLSKLAFLLFNLTNPKIMEPFAPGLYFMTDMKSFVQHGMFDETVTQSEDFLLSKKYRKKQFHILNHYVTQDDRRFKKMGYIKFMKLLFKNYINRNNIEHFRKNVNYW